jgi:hypothetical protein
MTTVLQRTESDQLRWRVLAGWTDDGHLMTQVFIDGCDNITPIGGFGGPAVWEGELINYWYGQAEHTPTFVVIRARSEVRRVLMTGAGPAAEIPLSDVMPAFGVRFGGHRLLPGQNAKDVKLDFDVSC